MVERKGDWHPILKIFYWLVIFGWIIFILTLFASPNGVLDKTSAWVFDLLTPKYVTIAVNSFAWVGAYTLTRVMLIPLIDWRPPKAEVAALGFVVWVALSYSLFGARCDVYVFCSEDVKPSIDCEVEFDRAGPHCR